MAKKTKTHAKLVVAIIDTTEGTTDLRNHKVLKGSKQHQDLLNKYWNADTEHNAQCSTRVEKHRVIHTTVLT